MGILCYIIPTMLEIHRIPFMSLSTYQKMQKVYDSLQKKQTVTVEITKDMLKKIKIPKSIDELSKEFDLSYDDLVNILLTEFDTRMNKDIRLYTRDIINIVKSYPGLNEQTKKDLLVHILKQIKMENCE